jgi:ferredoxin
MARSRSTGITFTFTPLRTMFRLACFLLPVVLQLLLGSSMVASFSTQTFSSPASTGTHMNTRRHHTRTQYRRSPFLTLHAEPHDNDSASSSTPTPNSSNYTLQVSYEGQSCQVVVQPGETILAALERSGIVTSSLCLPDMPSDCRKGNCLTCAASHHSDSQKENLVRGEDGLAPAMSQHVAKEGYVLTCSSYLTGSGVHLTLGENHQVWEDVYKLRLEDERLALETMARIIRRNAEQNVEKWAKETEEVLRNTRDLQ